MISFFRGCLDMIFQFFGISMLNNWIVALPFYTMAFVCIVLFVIRLSKRDF